MQQRYLPPRLYDAGGDIKKQWFVAYSVTDPKTGKMKRFKVYDNLNHFKTKREKTTRASLMIAALGELLAGGWSPFDPEPTPPPPPTATPLLDILKKTVAVHSPALRLRSAQSLKGVLQMLEKFLTEQKKTTLAPDEFTHLWAIAFCDWLVKVRKVGNQTRNGYRENAVWLWNIAAERRLMPKDCENPFRGIRSLPEQKNTQYVPFTQAEIGRLTRHMAEHCPNMGLYCAMIYFTAARPNELCLLQRQHIDFGRKRLRIPAHIAKDKDNVTVALSDFIIERLRVYAEDLPGDTYLFTIKGNTPQKVQPAAATTPSVRNRFSEAFARVKKECDIRKECTMYSYKHFAAIAAHRAGVPIEAIKEQFRHSDIGMTYRYMRAMGESINQEYANNIPDLPQ